MKVTKVTNLMSHESLVINIRKTEMYVNINCPSFKVRRLFKNYRYFTDGKREINNSNVTYLNRIYQYKYKGTIDTFHYRRVRTYTHIHKGIMS